MNSYHQRRHFRLSSYVLLFSGWIVVAAISSAQEPDEITESSAAELLLPAFGIDVSSEIAVARFLTSGISESARLGHLPSQPRLRVQLLPMAMEVAVKQDNDLARAPLMRLLQGDYGAGIRRMIDGDAATLSGGERAGYRAQVAQLLQYNAANSLSLLGEPAARPHISRLYHEQVSDFGRVQYALAAATLGERGAIDSLIELARRPERVTAAAALQALEHVSGEDFGASIQAPAARRASSAQQAAAWWKTNKARFRPDTEAIVARRFAHTPDVFDRAPRSLRDHLKYAGDFSGGQGARTLDDSSRDPDQPRASRRLLGQLSAAQAVQLGAIAADLEEDIDVRLEAIRWMVHADPEGSRSTLKSLRRDPDPEIGARARQYLER